jgi:hypothetical protein
MYLQCVYQDLYMIQARQDMYNSTLAITIIIHHVKSMRYSHVLHQLLSITGHHENACDYSRDASPCVRAHDRHYFATDLTYPRSSFSRAAGQKPKKLDQTFLV